MAGTCYIQDRGVSRWDTCAAQAVLEAHGGCFAKLSAFAGGGGALANYRYVKGDANVDFEPGLAFLTAYNARSKPAEAEGGPPRATAEQQLKPYSNTCGLVALPPAEVASLDAYRRAVAAAAAKAPPAFD